MDDKKIIDLYWKRSESAIAETDKNMEDIAVPLHLIFYITGKMQKSASMIPILRFGG